MKVGVRGGECNNSPKTKNAKRKKQTFQWFEIARRDIWSSLIRNYMALIEKKSEDTSNTCKIDSRIP